MTDQQIAEEKKEAQYNAGAMQVMQLFIPAYAKLHGYFRMAAAAGQGAIPHKICTSSEGREITVYNTNLGQVVGSYLTPTHEYITKALSQNKIGLAIGAIFGGQSASIKEQQGATCVIITPNEVLARFPDPIVNQAPLIEQLNTLQRQADQQPPVDNSSSLKTFIKNAPTPVLVIGTFGISIVVILTIATILK